MEETVKELIAENVSKEGMNPHFQEADKISGKSLKLHINTNHNETEEHWKQRDLKSNQRKDRLPSKEQ